MTLLRRRGLIVRLSRSFRLPSSSSRHREVLWGCCKISRKRTEIAVFLDKAVLQAKQRTAVSVTEKISLMASVLCMLRLMTFSVPRGCIVIQADIGAPMRE